MNLVHHHFPCSLRILITEMNSSSSDLPLLMISLLFIMLGPCVSQMNNARGSRPSMFTIVNNCNYTVWPGVTRIEGTTQSFPTTGFILQPGDSTSISIPRFWTGQIWGRTLCTQDSSSRNFSCLTGDCGSSTLECSGSSPIRLATIAEFNFNTSGGLDFYDVSLFMGYNLPIMISPYRGTGGDCSSVGCTKDLNADCPVELKVVNGSEAVACKSACDAFGDPRNCCTGEYGTPSTCKPSEYTRFFKTACPTAYSYVYDDATSIFTCAAADYNITFCPSSSTSHNLPPSPAPSPAHAHEKCRGSNECHQSDHPSSPTYTPNNNNNRGSKSKSKRTPLFIGLAVAVTVFVSTVCFIVLRFKGKSLSNHLSQGKMNDNARIEAFITKFGAFAPHRYSYREIKTITNKFKDKLGQGGFGSVYKGKLPDGRLVAVKVLSETKGNGEDFMNEVASISRTSHVNVVSLLGFCFRGSKRALIYEFMSYGSLDKFIYSQGSDNQNRRLEWKVLYDIALGIARGLEYLHQGCNTRILHFDIKPHNILLDEDFCPKIADFGLSKLCERKESVISMTGARGTAGYIAPEVFSRNLGGVSHKSDVYSYGMMVLEMVGGRRNIDVEVSQTSEIYYPSWIYKHLDQSKNLSLSEEITGEEGEIKKKLIAVSLCCIQTNPLDRPSITKVLEMLQGNLQSLVLPPRPP